MQDRIIMVAKGESMDRLFEEIPRENIPEKFGGKLKPIDQKKWFKAGLDFSLYKFLNISE